MPGPGPHAVLDNACGIGTRALGLSAPGHEVAGTDLSPRSAARAAREAAARGLAPPVAAADMRTPPFVDASFDAVVCADNALPHLLTAQDVRAALAETRRVLRPGRATRPCGDLLRDRPRSEASHVHTGPDGRRTTTFQLWHRHADGGRCDLELFQLLPAGDTWTPRTSRATYWARRSGPRGSPGRPVCATPPGTRRWTPASTSRSSPPDAPLRLDRVTRGPGRSWTLWSPRRAGGPHYAGAP
ncbi:class I SAM-dependent methyltransferase [Streptomyces yangpuensis]|uniref:class I SAM-dependent methyltransferase n=1 Tax=Streptomyces yangpuensis TaxID=1648182 RepID=UPI003427755F